MIKADVKMNLNFPNFNFHPQLSEIAKKIITPDVQGRINQGIDIENKPYRNLDPKTVRQKQKYGLRTEPLLATGQIRKSPKTETVNNTSVRIVLSGIRSTVRKSEKSITNEKLGDILQNQGVRTKSGKRYFKFFGISEKAESKAIKFMKKYIKDAIKRGGRRTIR